MSKATNAPEKTAAEDLAGLRRQSAEIEAELKRVVGEKATLQKRLSEDSNGGGISERARRLLGREKTPGEPAAIQLTRLEEREAELSKASDLLFGEIVKLERQESVDQLAPLFEADRQALIAEAAAVDRLEDAVKARRRTQFAIEQKTAAVDFWTLQHVHGVKLPFDPRQAASSPWQSDFISEGTSPLTSEEKIRDQLFFVPTRVEQWREQLHELGVQLARPAVWAERAKGYVSTRKPKRGPNVFVRLLTTLADPIGTGMAGQILEVSADEGDQLIESRHAVQISEKEANQELREFRLGKKIRAGDQVLELNSREQALADKKGDAPVKQHLAGARVQEDRTPAAWTAVADE